jgi:hypothetical protein
MMIAFDMGVTVVGMFMLAMGLKTQETKMVVLGGGSAILGCLAAATHLVLS